MAATLGNRLSVLALLVVVLAMGFGMAGSGATRVESAGPLLSASALIQPPSAPDASDVLGANAACLVCHLTFVKESLARTHQLKGVACTKCHGASIAHANDEHIGATPPEVTYPRQKVDGACAVCHKGHDVAATRVIARFLERKLPPRPAAICTDCHGTHRIEKADTLPEELSKPNEHHEAPHKR